jgi:hypothetical protein
MYDPDTPEPWKLIRNFNASAILEACSWVDSADYKTVKVNIASEKEVILHEMSQLLDVMKKVKKEHEPKFQIKKARRRFDVYDRRHQSYPMTFEDIYRELIKKYKGKKTGVNLVIKDYQTAFAWIHGVPYKKYEKKKVLKSGLVLCDKCKERKDCKKEGCGKLDLYFSLEEGKRKEVLFNKGVTDIILAENFKKQKKKNRIDDESNWMNEALMRGVRRE